MNLVKVIVGALGLALVGAAVLGLVLRGPELFYQPAEDAEIRPTAGALPTASALPVVAEANPATIPPMDAVVPVQIETATFALG